MGWIASLARVIGSGIPFGSVAVQLNAELDARELQKRLRRIEDPISSLHSDVRSVSELIYARMAEGDSARIELTDDELRRYARALALLEGERLIRGAHTLTSRFAAGIWLNEPRYVLYMAALYEDPDLVERLQAFVDASPAGTWLRGNELAEEYALPLPVVRALLETYERRGLSILSKELGTTNYFCQA